MNCKFKQNACGGNYYCEIEGKIVSFVKCCDCRNKKSITKSNTTEED